MAHDPQLNGMKCEACGHALSGHNELGYCRRATAYPSTCSGSCSWHPSAGQAALDRARTWNEEHGAGKVRRRMESRGQSTEGVFR